MKEVDPLQGPVLYFGVALSIIIPRMLHMPCSCTTGQNRQHHITISILGSSFHLWPWTWSDHE